MIWDGAVGCADDLVAGQKLNVLVLRPQPAAARTARLLTRLGHQAILAPLLEIAPLDDGQFPLLSDGGRYAAVVAASANSFDLLPTESRVALAGLPAIVVGAHTAQAAARAGLRPQRVFRTANELASALREAAPHGRLLYIAGRERRPEIETALRGGETPFALVETYAAGIVATLPNAAATALRQDEIGAVLHYSARSAGAYLALAEKASLLPQALAPLQLCLSAAIARSLTEAGARFVGLAPSPNETHLLALLSTIRGS